MQYSIHRISNHPHPRKRRMACINSIQRNHWSWPQINTDDGSYSPQINARSLATPTWRHVTSHSWVAEGWHQVLEDLIGKQHGAWLLFCTALSQNPLFTLKQFHFLFVSISLLLKLHILQVSKVSDLLNIICVFNMNCSVRLSFGTCYIEQLISGVECSSVNFLSNV